MWQAAQVADVGNSFAGLGDYPKWYGRPRLNVSDTHRYRVILMRQQPLCSSWLFTTDDLSEAMCYAAMRFMTDWDSRDEFQIYDARHQKYLDSQELCSQTTEQPTI